MNEELKRALQQIGRYWHVCGHTLSDSEERYWETIWPAIQLWHEGEVAGLKADRERHDRIRMADSREIAGLREENRRLKAELSTEAHTRAWMAAHNPHPEARQPGTIKMPRCTRCGREMQAGDMAAHRVQADGTLTPEHWYSCPLSTP